MSNLFIKEINIRKEDDPNSKVYPFNIDLIKNFKTLELTKPVTFLERIRNYKICDEQIG